MENAKDMEVFKDIKGYPGYQISNYGRIWSCKRNRYLSPWVNNRGYLVINITAANGKKKGELIHRLVALAFIDNPENHPCVNHIDENKQNNNVSNLEWCSRSYNINYGTRNEQVRNKNSKQVRCLETDIIYNSGIEAAKALGTTPDMISKVLHKKCKTANGFHIEFVD